VGDRPSQSSPKLDAIAAITPSTTQDLAARLEEMGKAGRFNEKRVVHLLSSTSNSKNFAQ
jgi:hypothetical protein